MSQPEHDGPYSVHPDGLAVTYREEDDGGLSFLTSNHSLQDWCDELNEAHDRGASEVSALTAERDALKERVKELETKLAKHEGAKP